MGWLNLSKNMFVSLLHCPLLLKEHVFGGASSPRGCTVAVGVPGGDLTSPMGGRVSSCMCP